MRIAIIGTRGIPASYGGFETFAEEISKNVIKLDSNVKVTVVADKEQKVKNNSLTEIDNVDIIYSKYSKNVNPLLFYFDSIKLSLNCDIILSCGNGGGYFSFIPKFTKAVFITNPDGLEWKRAKWSPLKRFLIKTMEWFSVKCSDYLVCDSEGITNYVKENYNYKKKIYTIEYGAYINSFISVNNTQVEGVLRQYGLQKDSYHLVVSRLEPENNVDIIIDGYQKSTVTFPLVIVGNLTSTPYVETLIKNESKKIIFLSGIYDKDSLSIVRANALSYLHGHSVGGTNPSLLEAMGSENLCICHDNIFNRKTVGENGLYFKDAEELAVIFSEVEDTKNSQKFRQMKNSVLASIKEYYNWDVISKKYLQTFQDILKY